MFKIRELKKNYQTKKLQAKKYLSYDIETDSLKIGEGEILMISLVSDNFKKVLTWKGKKIMKKNLRLPSEALKEVAAQHFEEV